MSPQRLGLVCALLLAVLAAACNLNDPGISPTHGQIVYPVALGLSDTVDDAGAPIKPKFLYVINSNFQLQYNAGSIQSYDLDALEGDITSVDPKTDCRQISLDTDGGVPDAGERTYDSGIALADSAVPVSQADAGVDMDAASPDAASADGGPFDAGVGSEPADAAGTDAASASDGGVVVADAGSAAALTIPGDYQAPSFYGTQRGILCDGHDAPGQEVCCFSQDQVLQKGLLLSELSSDSYASGIAFNPDRTRMYVPVLSKNKLLYVDIHSDGTLSCESTTHCRRGVTAKSKDQVPDQNLPPQPTAVVAGKVSELGLPGKDLFIATVHSAGELSFFTQKEPPAGTEFGPAPVLQDVLTSTLTNLTSITLSEPIPDAGVPETLYATSVISGNIFRVGIREVNDQRPGQPGFRPELFSSPPLVVGASSAGISLPQDVREVQVNPADPKQVFALFGTNGQQAVAFIEVDPTTLAQARLVELVRLDAGPSKLRIAHLGERTLLFASCYNAGTIYVIDLATRETVSIIRGFSGPFDMAIDVARQFLYVADFRASVVRVVDVQQLANPTLPPPRIIATIGALTFTKGLQ